MSDRGPIGEEPASSVCPRCGVGCRLEPGEDGRARGVVGPANPEGRLCASGVAAYEGGDRLTEPLVRRAAGTERVSWEAAYDRAVEGLAAVRAAHGPDALAFLGAPHCTNEENYLLEKLARLVGTNNVDNRARHCHVTTTRTLADRLGWAATTNPLADLADADVILVAGANPAERQPVAFNSFVRPAVSEGATLLHIDPVGNRTTRLAECHLAPRPGTDALVFDLLSAAVLAADGVDHAFVEERTRGYAAFADSIGTLDHEAARAAVGIDSEGIERVAEHLLEADRVAALVGTGIEGAAEGPNAAGALLDLLLATGNLGRPGTGVYVLRGLLNEQGATDAGCVPDWLPGQQPVDEPAARERVAAEWGTAPPATPGKPAGDLLASFGEGIRGAVIVGENPAVSKHDPEWLRAKLAALDVLVVLELRESDTAAHADVVLPVAAGTEKAGTVTNLDRHVQRTWPTADPPGDARSDYRVLRELGARLVSDRSQFAYDDVGEVFAEWTRLAPTHAGLDYDDLGVAGQQWPVKDDDVRYAGGFATADGRARFGTDGRDHGLDDTADSEGLSLVTGGRAGEFDDEAGTEGRLRIHPADASARGVATGDSAVVSTESASVDATVERTDRIRQGTVYLPASVADPLLRGSTATVRVTPASMPEGTD